MPFIVTSGGGEGGGIGGSGDGGGGFGEGGGLGGGFGGCPGGVGEGGGGFGRGGNGDGGTEGDIAMTVTLTCENGCVRPSCVRQRKYSPVGTLNVKDSVSSMTDPLPAGYGGDPHTAGFSSNFRRAAETTTLSGIEATRRANPPGLIL